MSCEHPQARQELARQILLYSRRYITQKCPILLAPIYALRERVSPIPGPLATDGVHLWYDPEQVIRDFQAERSAPARQLLHVTLHCLLGHLPARALQGNPSIFDLAADWKTARFIENLDLGEDDGCCKADMFGYLDSLPLARLVQRAREDKKSRKQLAMHVQNRHAVQDDHSRWNPPQLEVTRRNVSGAGSAGETDASAGKDGEGAGGEDGSAPDWEGMRKEMAGQARQNSSWGSLCGMLEEELDPLEDNGISYEQFLRRFAAPSERLLLDPDSFDPRWYYLGLEQYGDIPLLEPSELSEPPMPDDIVIALDTSGSCYGEVCRRFLRETLSLLRDISAGASSFRVLVLQCDTQIQQELLVETADQLDGFLEEFTPKGFGGTDFCPVFDRVARRRAEGVLPRVKGLLYLSDGYGGFPEEEPDYPVTFLMLEDDCWGEPDLPSWVTALWLNEHDFTLKEAQQ